MWLQWIEEKAQDLKTHDFYLWFVENRQVNGLSSYSWT